MEDSSGQRLPRLRVFIAEDDEQIRGCLFSTLQPEHDVVGTADNGLDVLPALAAHRPDILILDISLPGMNGLRVASQLRDVGTAARIVFLSAHDESAYVQEALRLGAAAYVLKGRHVLSDLEAAIRSVSTGEVYVSPELQIRSAAP